MGSFLRHSLLGINQGNFDIGRIGVINTVAILSTVRRTVGVDKFFAPRCNFTNNIVEIGKNMDIPLAHERWFLRSQKDADGGIIDQPYDAVVIFNADCPIVAVHEILNDRLAVLHAGFRCLVPSLKKGGKKDKSIIRVLFEDHDFSAQDSRVFVGYGIGPCCFGVTEDDYPEILDFSADIPYGRATRNIRSGWKSIDLYQLIANQLLEAGVPEKNVSIDFTCTSCAGFYEPKYYSVSRLGQIWGGRNAAMAWLEYRNP